MDASSIEQTQVQVTNRGVVEVLSVNVETIHTLHANIVGCCEVLATLLSNGRGERILDSLVRF